MNQDKILDALNLLDDDMIEAVDVLRIKPKVRFKWGHSLAVAACVAVAVFGAFAFWGSDNSPEFSADSNIEDNVFQENAEDIFEEEKSSFNDIADTENKNNSNCAEEGRIESHSLAWPPVYVEILEFNGRGLKACVIRDNGCKHFEENEILTVIYGDEYYALTTPDFKIGDKVYVFYWIDKNDRLTIYTSDIVYEENDYFEKRRIQNEEKVCR